MYKLTTHQGITIGLTEEFVLKDYLDQLNQQTVDSVAIGAVSTLKNNIREFIPVREEGVTPEGQKLLIYTNRRQEPTIAYAEDYNSVDVTTQYNDRTKAFLRIGDVGIHRNEYSLVVPASE